MELREDLIREEDRRIRRLRMLSDLVIQVLASRRVTLAEANDMIFGLKEMALDLFPGKEQVFDLIYLPRFRRVMREAGYYDGREFRVIEGGKSE
jgi:hypothetical protein